MNQPDVSVIVPVYKAARSLRQCLDSLLAQTFANLEIIAVDDASPDGSAAILTEYSAKDSRIKVIVNERNLNLYDSRLKGFAAARGRYFSVCDADDCLPPDAIANLFRTAERHGADIVHGRTRELGGVRPGKIVHEREPFAATTGPGFVRSLLAAKRGWNVWGKLYRAEMVRQCLEVFPTNADWFVGEDLAFSFAFGLAAKTYAGTDDTVYFYRHPGGGYFGDASTVAARFLKQLEVLDCIKFRILGGDGTASAPQEDFDGLAQYIVNSCYRQAPAGSRAELLRIIETASIKFERPSTLPPCFSPAHHLDFLRRNGPKEYFRRLSCIASAAERLGPVGVCHHIFKALPK